MNKLKKKPLKTEPNSGKSFYDPITQSIGEDVSDEELYMALNDLALAMTYFMKGAVPSLDVPSTIELLLPYISTGMTLEEAEELGRLVVRNSLQPADNSQLQ